MLCLEVEDLNLVINSVSEGGPTQREVREHREELFAHQAKLREQLQALHERVERAKQEIQHGVLKGGQMYKVRKDGQVWNKVVIEVSQVECFTPKKNVAIRVEVP